jgi:hypothetical protein
MLKQSLLLMALLPAILHAECVLTDRVSTASAAQIQERAAIRRDIVPAPGLAGYQRCQISFRGRVGAAWYTGHGYHDWPGDRPSAEACNIAQQRADDSVRLQVGPSNVQTEKVMVCSDRENMNTLRNISVGTQADIHQFRPHPNFPREFWHNGTRCRWFTEPSFNGQDIHNYQGVICQLNLARWVVVDKF